MRKPREAIVHFELYRLLKNCLASGKYSNVDVEPEKATLRGSADLALVRKIDGREEALLIIEVKSPKNELSVYDEGAREQAKMYADDLNAGYYAVTNGRLIKLFRRPDEECGCYYFELSEYCVERFLSDFFAIIDGLRDAKEGLSLPKYLLSPEIVKSTEEMAEAMKEVLEGFKGQEGFHLEVGYKEDHQMLYLSVGRLRRVLRLGFPYPKVKSWPYVHLEVRALKEVLGAEKAKELLCELSEVPSFGWIDDRDLEKEFIYHSYVYEPHLPLDPTKMKMKAEELKQRLREWLLKLSKLVS
jgi:hypothetical protein